MLPFGIALATCFVPGYLGATIPTQWASANYPTVVPLA